MMVLQLRVSRIKLWLSDRGNASPEFRRDANIISALQNQRSCEGFDYED
jgi:hypothetical protein